MTLSRRRFFGLAAGAAATLSAPAVLVPSARAQNGPFVQPPLPYGTADLAPVIGQRTVELHYGIHHAGYYRNLNSLVEGTALAETSLEGVVVAARDPALDPRIFNNAGQAWNHDIYWAQMVPGGSLRPTGRLAELIDGSFGGFEAFVDSVVSTAGGVFGTGWAWLVQSGVDLGLMGLSDADNPLGQGGVTTLLGVDVWEHAYYLDYENRRGDHVRAVLESAINWDVVAARLA